MAFLVGDVLFFNTTKVIGHEDRDKRHVVICFRRKIFLYISSVGYRDDFKIAQKDYPELPKKISYLSCASPVRFHRGEWFPKKPRHVGRLTDDCLERLLKHVDASESMTEEDMEDIVDMLAGYLYE